MPVSNTKLHNLVDLATLSDIVNADISASAAIADTKLGDITTGNKVRGTAIGNLASVPSGAGVIPTANIPLMSLTSIPASAIPYSSLTSIPNSALVPLTLVSLVDGISFRNLASVPTVQQFPYNVVVSSLASGSTIKYNGANNFVGGSSNPGYTAGPYIIAGPSILENTTNTSYEKLIEIYLPRGGALRISFGMVHPVGNDTVKGRIYRNGAAVGTEQVMNTPDSAVWTMFTEDITGWAEGDLLQLYGAVNSGTGFLGLLTVTENIPAREIVQITPRLYGGLRAPYSHASLGQVGDIFVRLDAGASPAMHIKNSSGGWTSVN